MEDRAIAQSSTPEPKRLPCHWASAQRVLVAGLQWEHHAGNSGYYRISRYLEPCERIDFRPPSTMNSLACFAALSRFDLRIRMRSKRFWMTHVLYADSQAIMTPGARSGLRYVGTIHLPISPLRHGSPSLKDIAVARRRKSLLGNFAGLVVLASSQVDEAHEAYPRSHVRFIPHGVEIPISQEMRSPASSETGVFRIAVVGSNYRNWEELNAILRIIAHSRPHWAVHIIGVPKKEQDRLRVAENMVIEPRLNDFTYYGLLSQCHALLLPLTFATANNALLEAHALGTVSVCSDVPGIRDYGLSTTRLFTGPDEAIDQLDQLNNACESDRQSLCLATRAESARFGWPAIAERTREFYRTVAEFAK